MMTARFLSGSVSERSLPEFRTAEHGVDADLSRIVLIETTTELEPTLRADRIVHDRRGYRPVMHANFVISSAAKRINAFALPVNARRKLLVPHQFSGLVTMPADLPGGGGQPFWSWAFEAFFRLVTFPIQLLEKTLDAFCRAVLGNGESSSVRSGWISGSELDIMKRQIDPDQRPCTPSDAFPSIAARDTRAPGPEEAGFGLTGYPSDLRLETRYVDSTDRVVSAVVNAPFDSSRSRGWIVEPDIRHIALHWISRDHDANDGLLIGSFIVFEEVD